MSMEYSQRFEPLATEVVDKLDTVARTALDWLASPHRLGIDALELGSRCARARRREPGQRIGVPQTGQ